MKLDQLVIIKSTGDVGNVIGFDDELYGYEVFHRSGYKSWYKRDEVYEVTV